MSAARGRAAISTPRPEDWHKGFALNFFSALDLCRLVVPAMREQQGGCVINISSIYGREWGGPMTYNASKAAMISLSKEMARELAPHGVRGQQRSARLDPVSRRLVGAPPAGEPGRYCGLHQGRAAGGPLRHG